ncbi:MAG: uracil-DNA glycosylase family protein [Thermodesulfobacteriota bacterium]
MLNDEYHRLIEDLEANLRFMEGAGLAEIYIKTPVMEEIEKRVEVCRRCALHKINKGRYFGRGSRRPKVVFVASSPPPPSGDGGAPSEPFNGEEGELLGKIIKSLKFEDKDVYLTYAVKCAVGPGEAGEADVEEGARACAAFLKEQIRALKPRAVIALGPAASVALTGIADVKALRGSVRDLGGIRLVATYGPAELIQDESLKAEVWDDIKGLLSVLKG